MKLNHLNLPVANVAEARDFFITYLGFSCVDRKINDTISILTGSDGFTLVIISDKLNNAGGNIYPEAFHIGFFLDDEESVMAMYQKLKEGGLALSQEPQRIRRTFGFYFRHQGIMIEIAKAESD